MSQFVVYKVVIQYMHTITAEASWEEVHYKSVVQSCRHSNSQTVLYSLYFLQRKESLQWCTKLITDLILQAGDRLCLLSALNQITQYKFLVLSHPEGLWPKSEASLRVCPILVLSMCWPGPTNIGCSPRMSPQGYTLQGPLYKAFSCFASGHSTIQSINDEP